MPIPTGALACFLDERDDEASMLVGGFYLPRSNLRDLDRTVSQVKERYGIPKHAPVKWNLRDQACVDTRTALAGKVDDFRTDFFRELRDLDIRLLMSLVWKGDPSYRVEAWKWSFENILQRLCIILDHKKKSELRRQHDYPFLDVVFDWLPTRSKVDDYFRVYSEAYNHGYQFIRNRLPALRACDACPCLLVSSVKHSPALQAADLLLGAVGDFFTWVFKGHRETSVRRHFVSLYDLFHRSDSGSVLGMGLIVKSSTRRRIQRKLRELGLDP